MAGELVASVVVDGLLSKLRSGLWSELGLLWNFKDDLEDMQITLESIGAVLNHAEKKSSNDEPVRLWLKRLKAAAYDIEDMFDELPTQNRLLYSPIMSHKLKGMRKRLDKIEKERSKYNLIREDTRNYYKEIIEEQKTSSVVIKDEVLGRDQEATQIINRLLMSTTTNGSTALSIIPIVGIGGLGKTTLAKLIYNDDRMMVFQPRIWVHAVDLEVEKLIDAILSSPEAENRNNLTDYNAKMTRAKEILEGKRYLIVLDDVWNKDMGKWEIFKQLLHGGKRDSRIIVTTRSKEVGLAMRAEMSHKLEPLPDDVCLELFERRAFESAGAKDNHLASIGKEIVKKCQGVPLTANSLGGMLFGKGEATWKNVKDSDLWKLAEEEDSSSENKIIYFLYLSYQHMPSALKLCFVYCSSYPKAFKLDKDMLIQQWIAQRFIQTKDEIMAPEIGDNYVKYLLSISFLEEQEEIDRRGVKNGKTYMKMHDLVYDLARWVAGDEVSDALESGKYNAMECRYASVINYNEASKELGKALPRKVRALHFQDCTSSLPKGIFSYTKCLRVLDFRRCFLDELPTSIYRLKQLRYLRLPNRLYKVDEEIGKLHNLIYLEINHSLSKIPNSIGSLQRLNSLKLAYCFCLTSLPESLGDLANLVTLELYYCYNLGSLPESLFNLKKLRTLDVRGCAMLDLDELRKASCKMRDLKIQRDKRQELLKLDTSKLHLCLIDGLGGHHVRNVTDAIRINLKERGGSIKSLTYRCGGHKYRRAAEAMLEELQPHQNLQELQFSYYGGSMFPSWMMSQMESFLPNLVKIELGDISNCEHLPVLGQLPKLEEIVIKNMPKIRTISEEELCGAKNTSTGASFPSLKRLELTNMPALEEWVLAAMAGDDGERGASLFSCLEDLTIENCSKLRRIHPYILPSLKRLELVWMYELEELVTAAMAGDDGERGASLFPCLEELTIRHCSKLRIWVCIPSLRRLSLINQDHLALQPHQNLQELLIDDYRGSMFPSWMMSQMESFLPNLVKIELVDISNCEHLPVLGQLPKLKEIVIKNMQKIRRISEEELCGARNTTAGASFPSLKRLVLLRMNELEEWVTAAMAGDDGERGASLFPCLEDLSIDNCSKLRIWVCIPSLRRLQFSNYGGSMLPSWMMSQMESFLPNLVNIKLTRINNCEHLPVLGQLPKLEEIVIQEMPKVRRISEEELCGAKNTTAGASFPSLKRLDLTNMPALEEWVTATMAGDDGETGASLFSCLEDLTIENCSKLRRIHPYILPSLKRLELVWIYELEELVSAAMAGDDGERGASLFPCLDELIICRCPKLLRIHPCITSSLKRLVLWDMDELEEWVTTAMTGDDEERGASLFPCLEDLTFCDCYKLRRIHPCIPPSVRRLSLSGDNFLHLPTFLDVPEMPLLKHLDIYDYDLDSFHVRIRLLTSLETLALLSCKLLTTFPEWLGELSQLQHLTIYECPRIDRLPESIEHLAALKMLRILRCNESLLERTQKETGEDWDKISHINNIKITTDSSLWDLWED